jgi:hypothetical protein
MAQVRMQYKVRLKRESFPAHKATGLFQAENNIHLRDELTSLFLVSRSFLRPAHRTGRVHIYPVFLTVHCELASVQEDKINL